MLNLGRCRLFTASAAEVSTRAVDAVLGSTVIDMLGLLTLDWSKLFGWQRRPASFEQADFRRLERSGVNVFHPAVETKDPQAYEGAMRWIRGWNQLLSSQPCFLARIDSLSDLLQTARMGKIGLILGFQNASHFRSVADVEAFHRLGQRVSQLTYNGPNELGYGCLARPDRGLTPYGAAIVEEMNRVGMAVDVSHCGERTSIEAIGVSRRPVLITHSNCKALVARQPRCKSDRVIRQMAAGGGVMGITVVRGFVGNGAVSVGDVLDHFDHVAKLVGVEHVGLGSDVDVEGLDPKTGRPLPYYRIGGLQLSDRVFQLADGLLARGYTAEHLGLILGGNFRRALAEIWSDAPWDPVSERELRRDPFCPAPAPASFLRR
jgi:membrane dipeptidase